MARTDRQLVSSSAAERGWETVKTAKNMPRGVTMRPTMVSINADRGSIPELG
jgi:hypothetical protein